MTTLALHNPQHHTNNNPYIFQPYPNQKINSYAKLSNKYSQKNVFKGIVSTFLAFFASFAMFIYPNQAFLHPNVLAGKS